jgi:hypothetical protein
MRRIAYGLIGLLCCAAALVVPRLTAAAAASPACSVDYQVNSQWATGFTVAVSITNDGPAIGAWDLQYAYSGNQQLSSGWDANWSQSGGTVTAANASWNSGLAAGATVSIGAQFSYSGTNGTPTVFALNGTACGGSGTSTPPPPLTGPTVSLTSPTPNSTVPSGSTVTLSADAAAGSLGSVSSVEFYAVNYCQGNTTFEVGLATTAPYTIAWPNVPLGDFSIAAVVTDSQGASAMSTVEELTTTSDGAPPPCGTSAGDPIIAIVAPQQNTVIDSDTGAPVSALVGFGAGGGSVSSVTFTAVGGCGESNTVSIGTATAAPYTVTWAAPWGGFVITAVADDGASTVTAAPVEVRAGPGGTPAPCPPVSPVPVTSSPVPVTSPTPTPPPTPTPSPAAE